MGSTFAYKFYSWKLSYVLAVLSFWGTVVAALLIVFFKNISPIGAAFLTLDFTVVPFLIWAIGHHYFYEEERKFIPSEEYFNEYEKELHPHINSNNFLGYSKNIEGFVHSDTKLLLIYSLTGDGKSHLLKQAVEIVNKIDEDRKTLIIVPDSYHLSIEKHLDRELDIRAKYLIIVDNVDTSSDEVKKLLSYSKNKDIKVILTFKTCELNEVLEQINELSYEKIKIKWRENDLIHFLRNISNRSSINDEAIVISYSNPSLILSKFDAVNTPDFDLNELDTLVENIDADVYSCLSRFNNPSNEKENLINNLLCIVPFPENNDQLLDILKNQTNYRKEEIKLTIESLLKSEILKLVNHDIRFNSDILGYLYLYYKIKHFSSEELRLLVSGLDFSADLWQYYPKNIYENLGNASQIISIFLQNEPKNDIPSLEPYFSSIINGWIDEEETTFRYERKKRLEYLQYFCHIVPNSCLDLLNTYLDSDGPISPESYENYTLTTDDFGPIILKLADIHPIKNEIIEIIVKMESKGINGTYGNYRPNELIKYLVSPFENLNNESILETLDNLESFFDDWTIPKINILSSALNEIFSISKYQTNWGLFKFQSFQVKLEEGPKLLEIRDRALEILVKMVNHPSLEVKIEAINIVEEIGERDPKNEANLKDQLIKERREILTQIGNLINEKAEFKLLTHIEDLFLTWWALKTPGTEEAENYLNNNVFPRDLEYITSKYLISNKYVVINFDNFKSQAPDEGRWTWFVNERHDYLLEKYEPKFYEQLSIALNDTYKNDSELIKFLNSLDSNLSNSRIIFNIHNPILLCWSKINPDLFISIRENNDTWVNVPEQFKESINLALRDLDDNYIKESAANILSELPDVSPTKLNAFLVSLGKSDFDKNISKDWLIKVVDNGSLNDKIAVISYLSYIFGDDADSIASVVYDAVSNETELNDELVTHLWILSDVDCEKIDAETLTDLRQDLFNKLILIPVISYEAQVIVDFVLEDMDKLFNLIECRIEHYTDKKDNMYRPLPSEGFDYLKINISSYNDYKRFIELFLPLYQEKKGWEDYLDILMNSISSFPRINQYIQNYTREQVEAGNVDHMVLMLNFLQLNEDNLSYFVQIGSVGTLSGKSNQIKQIMYTKTSVRSYSGIAGEIPESFKEKIKILQEMYKLAEPGKFRNMIDCLIKERGKEIEMHKDLIEEFKHR